MTFLSALKTKTTAGFTLIELLVVIAIIAVLSTIGLSAFTSAQQRARDAKRRGDMKAVQDSFEQYYSGVGNNSYLGNCGAAMYSSLQSGTAPSDPKSGNPAYTCTSDAILGTYCACASLEVAGSGNSGAACNWGAATKSWHCVRNLQ